MLEIFSDTSLLLAIGIAFISTLIQSLTGFGFAIVSTPLLLMVYDAKEVVVLLQFLSVVLDTVFVFFVKDNIDWHFLKPLLIGSVTVSYTHLGIIPHKKIIAGSHVNTNCIPNNAVEDCTAFGT